MTQYTCPDCGGGFPSPETKPNIGASNSTDCCPWCGEAMDAKKSAFSLTPSLDFTATNRDRIRRRADEEEVDFEGAFGRQAVQQEM